MIDRLNFWKSNIVLNNNLTWLGLKSALHCANIIIPRREKKVNTKNNTINKKHWQLKKTLGCNATTLATVGYDTYENNYYDIPVESLLILRAETSFLFRPNGYGISVTFQCNNNRSKRFKAIMVLGQ